MSTQIFMFIALNMKIENFMFLIIVNSKTYYLQLKAVNDTEER